MWYPLSRLCRNPTLEKTLEQVHDPIDADRKLTVGGLVFNRRQQSHDY